MNQKIEKDEFSELEEIFKKCFGTARRKNKNVITTFNITKQQAREGLTNDVKISVANICNNCNGADKECEKCYGSGYTYNENTVVLKIPANIKNNDVIVIEKQGNLFKKEEQRGDLFIKIHIYGDKSKRKGKKIYE